jgi:heme a synthase
MAATKTEDVQRLGFDPEVVSRIHGTLVWVLIAVTVFIVWRLNAVQASATLVRKGEILVGTMVAQGAIGYLQYALDLPPGLVLLHILGATAVWSGVVWFNLGFHERWEDVGIAAYDGDAYPDLQPDTFSVLD